MIQTSLDWEQEETRLVEMFRRLRYQDFLTAVQVLNSIRAHVKLLSQAEVNARRNKTTRITSEKVKEINDLIEILDAELIFPLLRSGK